MIMNFCLNGPQKIATAIALILFGSVVIWRYIGQPYGYTLEQPDVALPSLAIAILYGGTLALLAKNRE